ncbi:MAG TPA: S53 family peptidase [Pseudonocardiaceae bacterium]|nr:S53 family peptidase [Pseudonocardiaceae bacterium]
MAGGLAAAVPATAATDGLSTIAQSHPQWATSTTKVADAAAGSKLTFRVYLRSQNDAGAEAAAAAVSTPNTASYKQYLTPAQVNAAYGPTQAEVASARSWLTTAGFAIDDVPSNNAYVEATGTAAQVNSALHTQLGEYKYKGLTLRAPSGDLSVPAALASTVLSIVGVDQSESLLRPDLAGNSANDTTTNGSASSSASSGAVAPPAGFRNAEPCGDYYGQKADTTDPTYEGQHLDYAPCGYKPGQLRSAYGIDQAVDKGVNGKGDTVAIVDAFASPTLYADAAEYANRNDPGHPLAKSQFNEIVYPPTPGSEDPTQCDAAGWYGEQTLDVEAVHAMAPGAKILFVGGADCQDASLDKALNTVVAGNLANEVSNSYGDAGEDVPAADVKAFDQIARTAVLEGIGLYFSSGDSGDEVADLGYPSADFSASDPWVTAVGGTSLGIGQDGKVDVQTAWETGKSSLTGGVWTPGAPGAYLYGSGGGTSVLFGEPFYQKGIVPDALARENQTGNNRGRVVPDVSMLADPNTGFLIGETQTFSDGVYYDQYRIGGTSLASPLLAGEMAVADQFAGFHHGFINPALYLFTSKTPALSDVTATPVAGDVRVDYANGENATDGLLTSVRSFNYPGLTIHTSKGYDNTTGLGTPSGWLFLALI